MKTMVTNKTLVSCAVATGLGLGLGLGLGSTAATADPVVTFKIQDVGSNSMGSGGYLAATDGVSGSFAFNPNYTNVKNYFGGSAPITATLPPSIIRLNF